MSNEISGSLASYKITPEEPALSVAVPELTPDQFMNKSAQILSEGVQNHYSKEYVTDQLFHLAQDNKNTAESLGFPMDHPAIKKQVAKWYDGRPSNGADPKPAPQAFGVFDRSDKNLSIYHYHPGEGQCSEETPPVQMKAGNNTTNQTGDPYARGSNGPAPNGTYPVQKPIATGDSKSFGPYFFPIGDCGESSTCTGEKAGDIARQRGVGIHAGRSGPEDKTNGCIRTSKEDIVELHEMSQEEPLTEITIQD